MSSVIEGQVANGLLRLEVGVNRLDAASARGFKKEIEGIWTSEIEQVELDFNRVKFVDSSGVGALLSIHKRLSQTESPVRLINVAVPVQSVIELLRLHRIFEIRG